MRLVSVAHLIVVLLLTGCSLSPLARHTADFSTATALVVDNSENAFRAANRLNLEAQTSRLVTRYDSQKPLDPHSIEPLISPEGIATRTAILEGLRSYAQSLADIAGGVSSKPLDDAASATGSNLLSLSQAITAAKPIGFTLSQQQANLASTALDALGQFLISQKIKSSVPKVIAEMDPNIGVITKILSSDIGTLRKQSNLDYEQMLDEQDLFIRRAGKDLSPTERRAEIQQLPKILTDKQATDDMLTDLDHCVQQLALTHHALAAAAGKKDAASLNARIAELHAISQRLNTYYKSLPSGS
jgi:hypothetical protein